MTTERRDVARQMLNKVPEVTLFFWIIKILCTTVGETAADFLNDNLGLGLTITTLVMSAFLVVALTFQFRYRRYVPGVYWLAVVLISVVGTLITDNLTDNFGVSLVTTTVVFSIALAAVFAVWYANELTLSIHTIVTTKREAFYWLAVLFTFALGTAAGDLTAERLAVGYWKSALLFAGLIAAVFFLHRRFGLNAILAFWIAYILTRPLGASIGDYLSQPRADGGLGLGTTVTSVIFLLTTLAVVVYLTITKVDRIERDPGETRTRVSTTGSLVLLVTNKVHANAALVAAVQDRVAAVPHREKLGGERVVHRAVIHRVVVSGFFRGVHHFWFENAFEHRLFLGIVGCTHRTAIRRPIASPNRSTASLAFTMTSAWSSGASPSPAARFVMHEMAATSRPRFAAASASRAVDIPTACAPIAARARISAGVS